MPRVTSRLTHRLIHRFLALLLTGAIGVVASPAAARAQSRAQSGAPVTRRYLLESKTRQSVDAAAIGGGRQQSELDRAAYLRITLADSAGGKIVRVLIDSLVNRGANLPPNAAVTADSARGKLFVGFIAADGTTRPFVHPADAGSLGTAVAGQFEDFFPTRKAGAATGAQWTTSSERPLIVPNGSLTVQRLTAYEAMGEERRNGATVSRVNLTFTTSVSGAQPLGSARATVNGTSEGSGSAFFDAGGVYLGGIRTEQTQRRMLVDGAPAPVVIVAESVTAISLLK